MEVNDQLLGLLGQGGVTAALLFLIWKVGTALVGAVKELGAKLDTKLDAHNSKLDAHTSDENEHHMLVREELAQIRGHFSISTPVHGVPIAASRKPSSPVLTSVRAGTEPGK